MTDEHSQPFPRTPDPAGGPQGAAPLPQHGAVPPQGYAPQPQGYAPGSVPPGYAPQGYPPHAQGYPPQAGYGGGPFAPRPSTGVRHWAWQLLYWAPIPILPLLVVPAVLLGLRGGAVRNGGVDEANSRAAINWSLTWLTAVIITGVLHFGMLFALTGGGAVQGASPQGIVLATTASLFGIAYIGGGIMTLVNVIRGWAAAARGEAARPLLAIRFWRE